MPGRDTWRMKMRGCKLRPKENKHCVDVKHGKEKQAFRGEEA